MKTLLLSLLLCCGLAQAQTLKSGVFEPPRAAPDIALPASTGKPFRLSGLRGKVVVLEFGYTHCPAVCPVSLAALVQARTLLGPAAAEVQVLFVTVDPERDSTSRLRSYLAQFDPGFIGIGGTPAQIAAVLRDYGISVGRQAGDGKAGYQLGHSSYLYFIDRRGMLRALMPFGRPAADIAHDLAILLKQ
ncbi:SCO family protein [Massilia niastensis]|uniref:SCO family protein n=1 Tax=Massilia niastensis TaxID=544911 RepID=UPI00037CC426|nr:SCO family protein [Massilia niastensis]